jgi:hypothetical protein
LSRKINAPRPTAQEDNSKKLAVPKNTSKNFKFRCLATTSRAAEVGMLLHREKFKDIIFMSSKTTSKHKGYLQSIIGVHCINLIKCTKSEHIMESSW